MPARRVLCCAIPFCLIGLACNALSGVDDLDFTLTPDEGSGGSGAGVTAVAGSGAGGSSPCGPGSACIGAAEGRGMFLVPRAPEPCPSGWKAGPAVALDPVDPGCSDCSCESASGMCTLGEVTVYAVAADCTSAPAALAATDGVCVDVVTAASSVLVAKSTPDPARGCVPSSGSPVPVAVVTCIPEGVPTSCGGGVCVPRSFSACVEPTAGAACPEGFDQTKTIFDVESDNRKCACACGAPEGQCNGAGATLYSNAGCGLAVASATAGVCSDLTGVPAIASLRADAGTFRGLCQPSAQTSGQVTFGPARTICCAAP